ncbi:Histone-lysine N-methyltransferase protein [Dioscorea alata]|uniref:Histone-lysine N-methyltransferase protein n=1 Tax=Dioscorea alata TaxID=55571 RepID=A0ACB7WKS0_DIOAL|nr:Histone-lysine N-methyltransferase protein [Dioscorea alata]
MAPRVQSKKVRSKKMGAALKVLTQYGFEKDHIVSTIKGLIEEYGGEDGWVFIEDNGYQVVVDSILDKQSSEQQKGEKVGESSSNPHVEQLAHSSGNMAMLRILCV